MPAEPPPERSAVATAARRVLDRPVTAVEPIQEGMNAVYRVRTGAGSDVVCKVGTATTGPKLLSEPPVLARLASETAVPVPDVLATAAAGEGPVAPAYFLAEFREGRVVEDVLDLTAAEHERLVRESGRHLARIHGIELPDGFGRLRGDGEHLWVEPPFETWPEAFLADADYYLETLAGTRFDDLVGPARDAVESFPGVAAGRPVDRAVAHEDYHPKNLVLAADEGADPLVRAVLDLGFPPVVDAPADLATAELTLVDLQLGGTDRARALRTALREAYLDERDRSAVVDDRYPYYRLRALLQVLEGFEHWGQFGREDDPDAVADRLRALVRDRVATITG